MTQMAFILRYREEANPKETEVSSGTCTQTKAGFEQGDSDVGLLDHRSTRALSVVSLGTKTATAVRETGDDDFHKAQRGAVRR